MGKPGRNHAMTSSLILMLVLISSSITTIGQLRPWPSVLPHGLLLRMDLASRTSTDPASTSAAGRDFGLLTQSPPAAVFRPSTPSDIASLIRFSYSEAPSPFPIAARGHGHSVWGQASAPGGVVVEMRALNNFRQQQAPRIRVVAGQSTADPTPGPYVDAGGEQLWVDVLHETLKHGLTPKSWTDYLRLTVGGTLSNAGISGQAFRHGPQISNVHELDVVTGKGETLTCSPSQNPDLFHASLGGLGQFGIITRARIALETAPRRVRWVRLMYTDVAEFTRDQERLISSSPASFDYVEGSLFVGQSPINSWRSSFFSHSDLSRIVALSASQRLRLGSATLFCIEVCKYYDYYHAGGEGGVKPDADNIDQVVSDLLSDLHFAPGFAFSNDVSYVGFLDRVHEGEMRLRAKGLWDVPHPWFNVLIPKSRIHDFYNGVFGSEGKGGIIGDHRPATGPILMYPLNASKWDSRTSAVIPAGEEQVFYSVGLLRSAVAGSDWREMEEQNQEILNFCNKEGIQVKQYMAHYSTSEKWVQHFGRDKWERFVQRKRRYDPKAILSPGQGIFALGSRPGLDHQLEEAGRREET